jgi:trigger factor
MNDEMAKEFGFDDVAALKEAVKGQIEGDYTNLACNKSKKELFDWLDANVKFESPSKMRELEFNGVWEQMQQAKAQGDPSLDKPEAELRKEYEEVSERRVRLGILLAEIGRKNNVQVGKDELTRAVMNQAQMFPGQEQKVFEFYQKNPEHVDELRGPIIEDKAVDVILGKVKRETKKVTPDELSADDAATDMAKAQPKKKAAAKKKADAKSDTKTEDKPAKKPAAKKAAPAKKKKAD